MLAGPGDRSPLWIQWSCVPFCCNVSILSFSSMCICMLVMVKEKLCIVFSKKLPLFWLRLNIAGILLFALSFVSCKLWLLFKCLICNTPLIANLKVEWHFLHLYICLNQSLVYSGTVTVRRACVAKLYQWFKAK